MNSESLTTNISTLQEGEEESLDYEDEEDDEEEEVVDDEDVDDEDDDDYEDGKT